jgi:hypothetical protein
MFPVAQIDFLHCPRYRLHHYSDRASSRFVHHCEATIMKNVEMTVEGTMLTIKVDLSKEFGPSASGKTIIIASTEGNVTIPNREEKVGLNVYRKK